MFQDLAWNKRLFEQSRNDNMLSQKVPQGPKGLIDRLVLFLSTTDAKLRVRALEPEAQKRFLRAVERCTSVRDRALAVVLFYTALRIGELSHTR